MPLPSDDATVHQCVVVRVATGGRPASGRAVPGVDVGRVVALLVLEQRAGRRHLAPGARQTRLAVGVPERVVRRDRRALAPDPVVADAERSARRRVLAHRTEAGVEDLERPDGRDRDHVVVPVGVVLRVAAAAVVRRRIGIAVALVATLRDDGAPATLAREQRRAILDAIGGVKRDRRGVVGVGVHRYEHGIERQRPACPGLEIGQPNPEVVVREVPGCPRAVLVAPDGERVGVADLVCREGRAQVPGWEGDSRVVGATPVPRDVGSHLARRSGRDLGVE